MSGRLRSGAATRTLAAGAAVVAVLAAASACTSGSVSADARSTVPTTAPPTFVIPTSPDSRLPSPGISDDGTLPPQGSFASPGATSMVGATPWAPITVPPTASFAPGSTDAPLVIASPPLVRPPAQPTTGPVPVISRVATKDRVVFLTIDDGYLKDPEFARYVVQRRIPLTMFLVSEAARAEPAFFKAIAAVPGSSIQNHSVSHPDLRRLSASRQKAQVCGNATAEKQMFGTRPTLFRPPYGAYGMATRNAARSCGMKAMILWNASMPSSRLYLAQGPTLRPGDIILLHFRAKDGVKNMNKLLGIIAEQNLAVGSLTDYVH